MTERLSKNTTVHLSELDEFLASSIIEHAGVLSLLVRKNDSQGNITIQGKTTDDNIEEGGVDFELSSSEYQNLDSINIVDFTNRTVYTSSAYEFFDFILMYFSSLECLVDFNGSSWRIRIKKFIEVEGNS